MSTGKDAAGRHVTVTVGRTLVHTYDTDTIAALALAVIDPVGATVMCLWAGPGGNTRYRSPDRCPAQLQGWPVLDLEAGSWAVRCVVRQACRRNLVIVSDTLRFQGPPVN